MTAHRRTFLIHLGAYVLVNAALFAVNALQPLEDGGTRQWWAVWPLLGWGIGVAAHGFAEWAESRSREGQLLADPDARGVAVHLFVYLAVNAFLIAVNLVTSPETLWSVWPLLGWGLGLAGHAWLAYQAVLRKTMERYAQEQHLLAELQLERHAAEIAAAIAPAYEPEPVPPPAARRSQTPARTTRKAAARRGAAAKPRAAAKTRTRPASAAKTTDSSAKKPAAKKAATKKASTTKRKTAKKPAGPRGKKP